MIYSGNNRVLRGFVSKPGVRQARDFHPRERLGGLATERVLAISGFRYCGEGVPWLRCAACMRVCLSTRLSWVGSCIVTYDSEWHIFCSRALFARRAFPLSFRDPNDDELTRWSKKKEDEQFKDGRSSCFHRSSFPDMKNHRGGDLESSRTDIFYRSRLPSFVASHFWGQSSCL